jgi:RES domain-containing protein
VKVSAWRILKRKLAKDAFSGEGARRFGGRWNSPGVARVYTAQSQSLAALEILVHLESSDLLDQYVVIEVRMDSGLITHVGESKLPRDWQAEPPPLGLQAIGDEWAASGASPVLQVPSSIIPAEGNFLLNPLHRDFQKLMIGKPARFRFDLRLMAPK